MAWRIDEQVVHGEIDNRVRGRVTGRIWFVDREQPVELDLEGNAWRDLAGRSLTFVNPQPKPGLLPSFGQRQHGAIGDCTASRKVRVPEIPLDQIGEYYAAKKPFPWHWGNSLYLEWFSTQNGRVVIESSVFALTIGEEIAWEMTAEEEIEQRRANGTAMNSFMEQLGELQVQNPGTEEPRAQTEEEAEKMQAESDLLADRINARVEREGIEHYERILDEELERRRRERGELPLGAGEEAARAEWLEEVNRAAEDAIENPDPELEAMIKRKHSLAERAFKFSLQVMEETEAHDWIPEDANSEHPVVDLSGSIMSAGAKLAGALNGEEWPPELERCAGVLVRLKRSREYLDQARLAADACAEEKRVDASWLRGVTHEIDALGAECDALIEQLRAKLARGFD